MIEIDKRSLGFETLGYRLRAGVAALVGAAAVSVGVLAFAAPREPHVSPHVAQLVDTHTASASTSGDPISEITPAAAPVSFQR